MGIISIKINKGTVFLDLIIASSIAILFISMVFGSGIEARRIFENAKEKKNHIESYRDSIDLFSSLGVGQTLFSSSSVLWSVPYGNEMKERGINISSSSVSFVGLERLSQNNLLDFSGSAICSADFGDKNIQGSYEYFKRKSDLDSNAIIPLDRLDITPINIPVNPSLPLTDIEVRNNTVYLSADSAIASDPDLIILDISNILNPTIISVLNTGPGLTSLSLAGKRLFASAPSTIGELHTIRLDNLSFPVLENRYKLPLPYATATPALGSAIFFDNKKVYLGTEKWDGQEFNIIDISNPLNPLVIGSFETDSKINDIFVIDNIAYISASNYYQLLTLNISDILNPQLISSFGPSGWERQEGRNISFFEQKLNLGRTSGGFDLITDHEVFSWDKSSSTTLLSSFSRNIPSGVYGILQDRFNTYLATRNINQEFQIFNHDLSVQKASVSLPIAPQVMTCHDDSIYILANRAPFIYRINFK